ncbi:MAG TPA: hypothetical protein VG817_10065, partial [Gemmatimonadales bacterium]|nr:hypothetical protein [Gemmatimonadales bacterium]
TAHHKALLALSLLVPCTLHPAPLAAQSPTSLTLYNDGQVLVRRTLPLEIPKGNSTQRLALGPIDPALVFPLDPGVAFGTGAFDAGVDFESVLRRSLGRKLTFVSGRDTTVAELVGVDPERYRLPNGMITFDRPGTIRFPAEMVALEPTYIVGMKSDNALKNLRVGYFAQGGGWQAAYQVILAGGKDGPARVLGQAIVNGGTLRFNDVELQLLAGQVNRVAEQDMAGGIRARREVLAAAAPMPYQPASEQKVGEFHLYTLPGRSSLEPGTITTASLFEPATARTTKTFDVRGQIPYWGGLPQYLDEQEVPVTVTYTVLRPKGSDLGDRPLPAGVARLYQPDSAGRLQLIGEAATDHSPAGEDLRLPAGTAFDLTAKRIQKSYSTRRDSLPGNTWRTIATADYSVTVTNAGDEAATVEVLEERGGEWSVVTSSVKPEKRSATRTVFKLPVPARGKATLTYRVRVVW